MTPTRTTDTRRARRAARRAAARTERPSKAGIARWAMPALIGTVVVVAAVAALILPGLGGSTGGGSSTLPPTSSAAAGSSGSAGSSGAIAPVVTGNPLPDFQNPTADLAVGLPAPLVTGSGFDGTPAAIAADGKPKVVLFLAHWCPHCQATVPLIQAWVDAGGVPSGIDLVSVVTSTSSAAPNYPPDAWLARENWTVPVIVDTDNAVARAYGLPAFPYWTFIAADGTIRARLVGELKIADLEASIRGLTGS